MTSPSFNIGHRYVGESVIVSHLDLYRVAGLDREDPGLLDDYVGPGRIAFVEWPQDGEAELSRARVRVSLAHAAAGRRRIEVDER